MFLSWWTTRVVSPKPMPCLPNLAPGLLDAQQIYCANHMGDFVSLSLWTTRVDLFSQYPHVHSISPGLLEASLIYCANHSGG